MLYQILAYIMILLFIGSYDNLTGVGKFFTIALIAFNFILAAGGGLVGIATNLARVGTKVVKEKGGVSKTEIASGLFSLYQVFHYSSIGLIIAAVVGVIILSMYSGNSTWVTNIGITLDNTGEYVVNERFVYWSLIICFVISLLGAILKFTTSRLPIFLTVLPYGFLVGLLIMYGGNLWGLNQITPINIDKSQNILQRISGSYNDLKKTGQESYNDLKKAGQENYSDLKKTGQEAYVRLTSYKK